MKFLVILFIGFWLVPLIGNAQPSFQFFWVNKSPKPPVLNSTTHPWPQLTDAIKISGRVHFLDKKYWDPFVFQLKNGIYDSTNHDACIGHGFHGGPELKKGFITPQFQFIRGINFMGNTPGIPPGGWLSLHKEFPTQYNQLPQSGFSFCNFDFWDFRENAGKIYQIFSAQKQGPTINPFSCNGQNQVIRLSAYGPNGELIFSLSDENAQYFGSDIHLNFDSENRPVLSFWNMDGVTLFGQTYFPSGGSGYTRLVFSTQGQLVDSYHVPFQWPEEMTCSLTMEDDGQFVLAGRNRTSDTTGFGEIRWINAAGQTTRVFQDSMIGKVISHHVDKAGNRLVLFSGTPQGADGILVLNGVGQKIWEKRFEGDLKSDHFNWFKGIDTLQWALGGKTMGLSNFGEDSLTWSPISGYDGEFVASFGLPKSHYPAPLTLSVSEKVCQGADFRLFVDDQTFQNEPENQFLVELSDATGSFSQPTLLEQSNSAIKMAKIHNGIAPGNQYKIRVRSTHPPQTGPEKSIEIFQGNVVTTQGNFSTCTDQDPITLFGLPQGGNWTGPGIQSGSYFQSPTQGIFVIKYTYDSGPCSNSKLDTITVHDPIACLTAVNNPQKPNFFSISPNPTSGQLILHGLKPGKLEIRCFNILGKLVFKSSEINQNHQEKEIFLPTNLSEGIYQMTIQNGIEPISHQTVWLKP